MGVLRRLPIPEVMLVLLGWLMYQHLQHLYTAQSVRVAAGRVQEALIELSNGEKGYMLTGDDLYLDDYHYYRRLLSIRFEYLCKIMPVNAENQHTCKEINSLITEEMAVKEATLELSHEGRVKEALQVVRDGKTIKRTNDIRRRLDLISTDVPAKSHSWFDRLMSYVE